MDMTFAIVGWKVRGVRGLNFDKGRLMTLKTKYKRFQFTNVSDLFPRRKTKTYYCHTPTGTNLGTVKWYSQWQQYCFFPLFDRWTNLFFSGGCSIDIGYFCKQLMKQRKVVKLTSELTKDKLTK